jgi:hypothetical protein
VKAKVKQPVQKTTADEHYQSKSLTSKTKSHIDRASTLPSLGRVLYLSLLRVALPPGDKGFSYSVKGACGPIQSKFEGL